MVTSLFVLHNPVSCIACASRTTDCVSQRQHILVLMVVVVVSVGELDVENYVYTS